MKTLHSTDIKTAAPIHNRPYRCCEALKCLNSEDVEPVAGPGGIPLTLCPTHRRRLLGVADNA